ncbi:MAG: hypothetical protein HOV80_03130 [Polyangiaceae bacterium]|nr:hypothetical protein [Polyangiaceae bacterium]
MLRRAFSALALTAAMIGCTPTTTTTGPSTGPTAVATGAGGGQVAGGALDMSPVPAPKSLILLVRGTNPKKTLDTVQRLVSIPIKLETLLNEATEGAAAHLDLGESFDVALALDPATRDIDDPKFFIGFSVPLSQDFKPLLDILVKDGQEVEQLGPELWRVREKSSKGLTCEVLAPKGRTPRLVCGEGESSYRELGPWLARTLPTSPKPTQDLWFRTDFGPVRDVIVPKIKAELDKELGDARKELARAGVADPELLDVPSVVAKELTLSLEELDRLEGGVELDASKVQLKLSGELSFRGNQSWLTKVLTDGSGKPAPAPDMFWRLPKDADSALFGRTADPALFVGLRRVVKKGLGVGLDVLQRESDGVLKDADKQAFIAVIDAWPASKGIWVTASGTLPPLAGGFPAGGKVETFSPQHAIVEAKNKGRALLGWSVIGGEGNPEDLVKFFEKTNDAYARIIRIAKADLDDRAKKAPASMKEHYRKERAEMDALLPKVKIVRNAPGYPKGSSVIEIDVSFSSEDVWTLTHPGSWDQKTEHPKGRTVRGTLPVRIAIVPDEPGKYFWGYAGDPEVLKQKLAGAMKGSNADGTLASRKDLERLKRPMQGGGFISYGRTLENFAKMDPNDRDMKELTTVLQTLPNKGSAPIFFFGGGKGGSTPSISAEMVLDKPWVEDISALVKWATVMKKAPSRP